MVASGRGICAQYVWQYRKYASRCWHRIASCAIVLRSSRAGNRSDPAMSELRALTYDQIKALSLEQARVACAARGLPTEGTLDGKVKTTRKPELKALLRVWVDENGREPAGAAGDVRPAKKSRRVVASQPSEGR